MFFKYLDDYNVKTDPDSKYFSIDIRTGTIICTDVL